MQTVSKAAAILTAIALVIVLALIVLTIEPGKKDEAAAVLEQTAQISPTDTPEPVDEPMQADTEGEETGTVLYEGALAGLTEEEIAALAMAEEGSALRTQDEGLEDVVD